MITVPFGTDALIEAKDKMVALRPSLANSFTLLGITGLNPYFPYVFEKNLRGPSSMPEAMLGNNSKKLDERLEMNLLGTYATLGLWRECTGRQTGADSWPSMAGKGCRAIRSNAWGNGLFKEWVKTKDDNSAGSFVAQYVSEEDSSSEEQLRYMDSSRTWVPNVRIGQADFSPFGKPLMRKRYAYGTHVLDASDFPDHSCWGLLYKEVKNWDKLTVEEKVSDKMPAVSLEIRTDMFYNRPPTECTYNLPTMTPNACCLFPFTHSPTADGRRKYTLTITTAIDLTRENDKYNCVVGMAFFDFANREIGW